MRQRSCAECRYFMHLHFASHPALEVEICAITGEMREAGDGCRDFEEDTVERFLFRVELSKTSGGRVKYC